MKNHIKFLAVSAFITAAFTSCEPELENPINDAGFYTSGTVDLSNYVAVGNSLTAGYADGALYLTGQQNSYPNIMAQQFALAGGGTFIQPLVDGNLGGLLIGGQPSLLFPNRLALINGAPTRLTSTPTTEVGNILAGPFNNMGVPGAKSFHLGVAGYGNLAALPNANPYFVRFASTPNATVIADAVAQNPSFFSLWIGNNDILSFATSGGVGVDQKGNLDPTTYGSNDITDPQVFAGVYSGYVTALMASTANGILVNIPDVTSIPFFTTVPFAPLSPLNPSFGPQIPTLNGFYAPLNRAFAFLQVPERSVAFSETGASPVVLRDESLPNISNQLTAVLVGGGLDVPTATLLGQQFGQSRQATATDLLVLTSSSVIGQPNAARIAALTGAGVPLATAQQLSTNGVTFPLEDQFTLTASEQAMVKAAQDSYNTTISALAASNDLILIDAKAALQQLSTTGLPFDGGILRSTFATGGAFSLDGVHPTPRGYAYIANLMISAINEKYKATIPGVNIGNYGTITVRDTAE